MKAILLPLLLVALFACQQSSEPNIDNNITTKVEAKKVSQQNPIPTPNYLTYSWPKSDQQNNTIINRIPVPEGYKRIAVEKGSFAEWLRFLPLFEEGHQIKHYDGSLKWNQNGNVAVVDMDVGNADLQQCADAIMRLQSEYYFGKKEYENIHFNYTSGDKVSFEDWRKGKRPQVKGNSVRFVNSGLVSDGYSNFRTYLTQIFTYAGTASLSKELKRKKIADVLPGDVFIKGGFPGHAVLVLDVAVNEEGEKIFMIGQSYMPAQEFHVLKNMEDGNLSPWYRTDVGEVLDTPEWNFKTTDLMTW